MEDCNEVLRAEHETIELLLSAVEGMAGHLSTSRTYPRKDVETALVIASEFADRCHHAKEERALFPALAKASAETGAELARRLTSDHVAFRKLVGAMKEQAARGEGEASVRAQLAKNLDTYVRLLREHIRIENTELLPEVERSISDAERARLAAEFQRIEVEEIGAGVHEKYHRMIHALADAHAA